MIPTKRILLLFIVIAATAAAVLMCLETGDRQPNILLISVDTLRHDRLGFMGHPRRTSPNIDKLARTGVAFTRSYSQSGWTLPSMATILTGLYPHQHGAVRFDTKLRPEIPTLATILRGRGYDTRGYVSHSLTGERYELDRGFDRFDSTVLESGHPAEVTTSAQITDLVAGELDDLDEPYFVWAHYFDPHAFYLNHQDFAFGPSALDRYDGEIAHNDRQIGRLLRSLEERGLLENTVIVFTADHGEEFEEHGAVHHFTLYDEVLRTPLVIKAPQLEHRVADHPVAQIDVVPTVLALLGIEADPELPGKDVLSEQFEKRPIFSERYQPNTLRQRSVIFGGLKLITVDKNPRPAKYAKNFGYDKLAKVEEGIFLFDIINDPGETTNLFAERQTEAMNLLSLCRAHFRVGNQTKGTIEMDAEMEERMRRLGYIK